MPTEALTDVLPLLQELLRFRAAVAVQVELVRLCTEHLHPSTADAKGLLPAAVFEGQQQQALARSGGDAGVDEATNTGNASARTWVHPILDVRRRATVQLTETSAAEATGPFCLTGVQYVPGSILGVLEPVSNGSPSGEFYESVEAATTAPLKDLRLCVAEPFFDDPLLPTLEAIEPHHASKNLLDLWLSKLCGAPDKLHSSFNQKRKKAWHLTDEATHIFYDARKRLAERLANMSELLAAAKGENEAEFCSVHVSLNTSDARQLSVSQLQASCAEAGVDGMMVAVVVEVGWSSVALSSPVPAWFDSGAATAARDGTDEISWQCPDAATMRVRLPIAADMVLRLHRRYMQSSGAAASEGFLRALATLQLRYHALCGGQLEQEAGWQAAVPPPVMDVFANLPPSTSRTAIADRILTAECFASPFNATRPFFFSAFPDTDAAFGSLGNFFACPDAAACVAKMYAALGEGLAPLHTPLADASVVGPAPVVLLRLECNPPFDHEVIAAAFSQLQRWLETCPPRLALSVLIIIPDSTQPHAAAVRASVEASPQCRWVRSMHAKTCLYVHGAQQQQQQVQLTDELESAAGAASGRKRLRGADGIEAQLSTAKLIQLSCPTRLLVLQEDVAEGLGAGAVVGTEVATAWRALSVAHDE